MPDWIGSLVDRPAIYSRNGVAYAVARNWRVSARDDQLAELKRAKAGGCCDTCEAASDAVAALIVKLFGPPVGSCVTSIACGHSRVPDCLSRRMGEAVAARLAIPFVQVWADRFVSGSSHPKQFANLPPLKWINLPDCRTFVIDDVATSGWHMEEALGALRMAGVEAFGVAWIGGKRDEDGNRGEPAADGSVFGGSRGGWPGRGKRGGKWGVQGG